MPSPRSYTSRSRAPACARRWTALRTWSGWRIVPPSGSAARATCTCSRAHSAASPPSPTCSALKWMGWPRCSLCSAHLGQPTDYYQRQQTATSTLGEHLSALGYVRKQTLTTAERFVTQELKEHERKVEQAHDRALALEQSLYGALLAHVAEQVHR